MMTKAGLLLVLSVVISLFVSAADTNWHTSSDVQIDANDITLCTMPEMDSVVSYLKGEPIHCRLCGERIGDTCWGLDKEHPNPIINQLCGILECCPNCLRQSLKEFKER